jgi:DNA-binding NarL/FixJ family response regulator
MNAVRVVIVDDQSLMREGLRTLLELHDDIEIVGEAADGFEAERIVLAREPDVVLMDLRMPRRDGIAATRAIVAAREFAQILVLTTFDDDDLVVQAVEAGAAGYLLKDIGSDALAEAIRTVARGESPLQPAVARKLLQRFRERHSGHGEATPPPALTGGESLTAREVEVLVLLGRGASNREIAGQLVISEGTVRNYISVILAKTGLRDRTQAAIFAVRNGIVLDGPRSAAEAQ